MSDKKSDFDKAVSACAKATVDSKIYAAIR